MFAPLLLILLQAAPSVGGEDPVAPYAMADTNAGGRPFADEALFGAFHGRAGIARIVDDLVARNQTDPRISDIFKGQDMVRLSRTLKEQLCYLLGGGCTYSGRDMATAHKNLGVQAKDMNAVVENLQAAMRRERVSFRAQNVLIGKLAPMKHDIVTR